MNVDIGVLSDSKGRYTSRACSSHFSHLSSASPTKQRRLRAEAEELSPGGSVEELARYAELLIKSPKLRNPNQEVNQSTYPQSYFEYDTVDRPESDRDRPLRSAAAD
jgi:hypothetical protein